MHSQRKTLLSAPPSIQQRRFNSDVPNPVIHTPSVTPLSSIDQALEPLETALGISPMHRMPAVTSSPGSEGAPEVIAHAVEQVAQEPYRVVLWAEQVLQYIHSLGLPWWATIVSVTVCLRLITSPFTVMNVKHSTRMAQLNPILQAATQKLSAARGSGYANPWLADWIREAQQVLKASAELQRVYSDHGVNPMKGMLFALPQVPVFILLFMTLMHMAQHVPSFHDGGALWFTNLAAADPYWRLPACTALSLLMAFEVRWNRAAVDQAVWRRGHARASSIHEEEVQICDVPHGVAGSVLDFRICARPALVLAHFFGDGYRDRPDTAPSSVEAAVWHSCSGPQAYRGFHSHLASPKEHRHESSSCPQR